MADFELLTRYASVLCICAMTACSAVQGKVAYDPEAPYQLEGAPRTGDIVHLPTGILVTLPTMLAVAGDARIVYMGEVHDNPAVHRLQVEVLRGLEAINPGRQALGLEMFSRSQQPALDRWLAGDTDEKQFLRESRWFETWGMDFDYYRDLLMAARDRKMPVVALNAEKNTVESLRKNPANHLAVEEQARLPEMDLGDPYQRGLVTAIFAGHSHGSMALDGFIRAQTLRDETMAESVAEYLAGPGGNKNLLVVAGGHHISHGFGIPRRVFRRLPSSYVLIGGEEINIPSDKKDRLMDVELPKFPMVPYDFLAYLNYENLPVKGVMLGVMVEPVKPGGGLLIKTVVPGSNADKAGARNGDIIHSMDGKTFTDNLDLVYAVKQKKPGERGILVVDREDEGQLELHVVFEAAGPDTRR